MPQESMTDDLFDALWMNNVFLPAYNQPIGDFLLKKKNQKLNFLLYIALENEMEKRIGC